MGLFSKDQLMELAVGLERSGQRFLWVVSNPPPNNNKQGFSKGSHPSLEGFLDRTSDGGLILKAWAPQVAVLVMTRWAENGLVSAEEVEKRVRELRKRSEAAAARSQGGTSRAALAQLVKCWA
ncbi:hypothetical protein J1N35_017082 [Gossypium stocksii]|uniref:Uncharacterized protein n=1 Tax=Gossypium stocksii TaxID=47602 RepID=A0A9D3VNL3_9ROSI|nr:hypothetical protein J1N35_017082 [Gossypium stocksii]